MKTQILVLNTVRVLGSGPHPSSQFFWEYPPHRLDPTVTLRSLLFTSIFFLQIHGENQEHLSPSSYEREKGFSKLLGQDVILLLSCCSFI